MAARPTRILFVCLGNICRSPTAEAVMRHLIAEQGAEDLVEVESAGTGGWHVGEPPDRRSAAEARRRGLAMDGQARQVAREDFGAFDLVVAMDRSNRRDLLALAPGEEERARVVLLRDFDPLAGGDLDVPDPYYGGERGFADVFEIVERSCRALLAHVRQQA